MKKICTFLLIMLFAAVIFVGSAVSVPSVSAAGTKEVTIWHTFPSSLKIGDCPDDYRIYYANLDPNWEAIARPDYWGNETVFTTLTNETFYETEFHTKGLVQDHKAGWPASYIGEDGTTACAPLGYIASVYMPGTLTIYPGYAYLDSNWDFDNLDWISVGDPIVITFEEPIIQTNQPSQIRVGESFILTTELTNTSLENTDTAYYLDPNNYYLWFEGDDRPHLNSDATHWAEQPAYLPSVEIIEGKDLVVQSNQDYSNTLKSSETLTFIGSGTVVLRVKYTQFVTCDAMYGRDENGNYFPITYNPEKIITIQVTDGEVVTPTLGDLGGDGEIDSTDYMQLKRFCLGTLDLTDEQKAVADVNKDGEIDSLDYMLIKRHVLGTYVIA